MVARQYGDARVIDMRSLLVFCLVPALIWSAAVAQEQTAPLTVGVVPHGQQVACDIGPPAIVPAEAAAAGFTHCAANWDFSQPEYATLSNWFDCDGSNPNVLWHSGSAGVKFLNPCNIHQKVDPVTGQTMMNFEWLPSYGNAARNAGANPQANQVGGQTFNNFANTPSFTVGNYYIETVNRLGASACRNCPQNSGGPNDVYVWGASNGGVEIDVQEFNKDSGGAAAGACCGQFVWTNWGPGKNAIPPGYSAFDYHKYAALLTSDGATSSNFGARSWLAASGGSNMGTATENIDFDLQHIRVWSCDAYKTSMCNGTTLATGGKGLKYWH
jgi:hypothetical protein